MKTSLSREMQVMDADIVGPGRDALLRARAERVVPNGMYGHLSARLLPANYPQFFAGGDGSRIWDVDGNEYIDFMCSWGPIILGHRHAAVDAAAAALSARGDVLNGPTPEMVDLSERLVDRVAHADWVMLAKNGNDATNLALLIARAATGRRKVLVANGAYHGIAGWSSTTTAKGMTPEDHANTEFFEYNDIASVEAAISRAGTGDIAAIAVTPIRHDVYRDLELATAEFARGVRAICDRIGAALILDDVRCGLRLDPRGSWEGFGVRPDLSAWSKSLANGYPLAALLGAEAFRDAACSVMATGSFWMAGAPMAAALATLDAFDEIDGVKVMGAAGKQFQDGLVAQAATVGVDVTVSGPPQLPFMTFGDDPDFERSAVWAAECARQGVYLVPFHNWFISAAHDEKTIADALDRTLDGFRAVHRQFGS